MDKLFAATKYLHYLFSAATKHDVHSPFVFDLLNNVILDRTPFYGFDLIESVRSKNLLNNNKVRVIDFGTGKFQREQCISEIAGSSVKPKKYAQLLFRLVNYFAPENILEIGTSLGISTLYLSLPDKKNRIITLEGSPEIAAIAERNFKSLRRENITLICGEFDETLPKAIQSLPRLDFVYFDGNHRKESTLSYFRQCLGPISENSIFVFDDIYWSREMSEAWHEIKNNELVTISIDLYQFGIVFFKKGILKQHFMLRF